MDAVKDFYQPAPSVLKTDLKFSRHNLAVSNTPSLKLVQPQKQVSYLKAKINGKGKLFILGSAEAYALTTALLVFKNDDLRLVPARLHFGPSRIFDNQAACFQGLQIPEITAFFQEVDNPAQQLLLADLLREGQLSGVQTAVYYLFDQLPTNALINVSHCEDDTTPLGRIAKVDRPNLEGVDLEAVTHMVVSDSIASGVTHFYALKYFVNKLPNLKKVLIVSPHLTRYGSLNLCRYLDSLGVKLSLLGYGALLTSRKPDLYFSPTPVNQPEQFVDPRQAELMKMIYPDTAAKLGVVGNWTAMFLSPVEAQKWFKDELEELGGDLSKIKKRKIGLDELEKLGFDLEQLVPGSTWMEAVNHNKQEVLKKLLAK